MLDLSAFSLSDMIECGSALRSLGSASSSMEDVAQRMATYLFDELSGPEGRKACALVRVFKSHPYSSLTPELKAIAANGSMVPHDETRCLALLGSAGVEPAWCSPQSSERHRVIPLTDEDGLRRSPMIAQLVAQLGLQPSALVDTDRALLIDLHEETFDVFLVPEAEGSPYVPDQRDFVIPYRISSVLGFGGILPSGEMWTTLLFSRVPVSEETADLFKTVALSARLALLPFVGRRIFESDGSGGDLRVDREAELTARTAALEELLTVYERAASTTHLRELRRSEWRFRSLAESALDGIALVGESGQVAYWNRAAAELLGVSREDVLGRPITKLMPELLPYLALRTENSDVVPRPMWPGSVIEMSVERNDGTPVQVEVSVGIRRSAGSSLHTVIFRDVTERKAIEAKVAERTALYETLIATQSGLGEGVIIADITTTKAVFVNDALVDMTGYTKEELMSMEGGLIKLAAPDEVERLLEQGRAAMREGKQEQLYETAFIHKDGHRVEVEVGSRLLEIEGRPETVSIVRDITTRKAAEGRMLQTSKMEAVGRVAGSVAHDFNNLLMAMRGNCELLLGESELPEEMRQGVTEIQEAVDVAAGITGRLLDVSRQRAVEARVVDVNETLVGMADLLRSFAEADVSLDIKPQDGNLFVNVDVGQLDQILLNLVINACDACEAGTIEIATSSVQIRAPRARRLRIEPGSYVRLSVADPGTGIAPHDLGHIFDPFFTTKDPAVAAGLGLSTVYNIAVSAQGTVEVETALGKGTRFDVYLPRMSERRLKPRPLGRD